MGDSVVGFEIRFIGRASVSTVGVVPPKSIIDPPNSLPYFRCGEIDIFRRTFKRSVLLDTRLFRLDDDILDILLFLIFGVETLLLRRGIFDGRILPLPPTTPIKPLW